MRTRLGINNCFAVKRWPQPDDWPSIAADDLVTEREPSTVALMEDLLTERTVAHAPVMLCLDLGHPFASGAVGRDGDPRAWLKPFAPWVPEVQLRQTDGLGDRGLR